MPPVLAWLHRENLTAVPPVLLLEGSEVRLAQRVVAGLRRFHIEEGMEDLCFLRLDGAEYSPAQVVEECQGMAMLAARKVVVVDGVEGWRAEAVEDDLLSYVADPNPATLLVLIATKLDGRTRATKGLKQHALHLTCEPADERQAEQWCRDAATHQRIRLAPSVPRLLVRCLGTDLFLLESEVAKLALQVEPGEVVETAFAEEVVVGRQLPPIWDFIGHVARRETAGALRTLHRLLADGQHPLSFLGLLVRQVRLLILAKEGIEERRAQAAIIRDLGLFPRQAEAVLRQADAFSVDELRAAYPRLLATDLDLKGRGLTPRLALEALVLELCGQGATTTPAAGLRRR
jgi:DNA polymerase-3 subunit delta